MFFMHKSTVKIDAASQVTVVVDRASREQLLVCNPCLKGSRRLVVTTSFYIYLFLKFHLELSEEKSYSARVGVLSATE